MKDSLSPPFSVELDRFTLCQGEHPPFFILGPCVIESEEVVLEVAEEAARLSAAYGAPVIFKSSYDKANRTSVESYRGPGIKTGLDILAAAREKTGLPILSDVHTPEQVRIAAEVLDALQIPAFLCRQTDLLMAAGRTGKVVNVKKGQFMAPEDMAHAVGKIRSTGNERILLTERGTSFGYQDLVVDMRSIVRMKRFGRPIVFDATHSAQFPSRQGERSGGDRRLAPHLARAAIAAGADGVFMEVHPDPDRALCDGPNSLHLEDLEDLMRNLIEIHRLVMSTEEQERTPADARASSLAAPRDRLTDRLAKVRLIILDVDGALTDGRIIFGSGDLEIKSFHVRDGHGIKLARRQGLELAVVTGRSSEIVPRRASELGITRVYQSVWFKKAALAELLEDMDLKPEQVAVIGDDVVDIPLFRSVGAAFTVPEAPLEVRREAHYITRNPGGRGAVREMLDMILKAQGKWDDAMGRYYDE